MKQRLRSLRFRIILPVFVIALFLVILQNSVFSHAFVNIILKQEQEVNTVGFATVSHSVVPLINSSISEIRGIMLDNRVISYARFQYASEAEMIHGRLSCRDFLRTETSSHDKIIGLLFMRKDGSLFGTMPEANIFLDSPERNPLPEDMKTRILNAPLGQTVWVGPISEASICGFENEKMAKRIMIAAWKSVNVSYGECYAMMLMDESVFDDLFAALQDGESTWYLFGEDQGEIWSSDQDVCQNPDQLLLESNTGNIFRDEKGVPVCTFSMKMESPAWTVVRKVSMERYEEVVAGVKGSLAVFGGIILLGTLGAYQLWLKKFIRQYDSLQNGIIRIGQGDLESTTFVPTTIEEFKQMQQEINRTRLALKDQMETIRRMEREHMELENKKKEQERIARELEMARQIQANTLPSNFPPFPERPEFSLYASMNPAKEVGGDFYDFFMIDSDHLALVIADVSGKGIPAALFMMASKTLINNHLMTGCDPATALERMNLQLCENNASRMFVTVWLAVLELSTGKGMACNAGHENPGLRREGGRFELLKYKHNMLVGVVKKAEYVNRPFTLHPGDSLFVYTDGVPEAHDADGKMFGAVRLEMVLNQDPGAEPDQLIRNVRTALDGFVKDAPQFDDVTMLALKYCGSDSAADSIGMDEA